jgi:hypothetical protein
MAQICTGYYNGRVRYLFLADFHGLFSRGLAQIVFFSRIFADLRFLSALICERLYSLRLGKIQVLRAKVEVRRAKFIDCIESENLSSSLRSVSR